MRYIGYKEVTNILDVRISCNLWSMNAWNLNLLEVLIRDDGESGFIAKFRKYF